MKGILLRQRMFYLKLAPWLPTRYASYFHWLSNLLERLGHDFTLSAWQEVFREYDDELLRQILGKGWKEVSQDDVIDLEESINELSGRFFPSAIEGITQEKARQLVEMMPPIRQIKQTFPSPHVGREISTYEALHMGMDGIALLTEALLRNHGKQGELIAYDVLRADRLRARGGSTGSFAEFIAGFSFQPEEANIFTAGLDFEVIHTSETELVWHVKQCEWARYFIDRHPQVGYLIACSTDEVAYRAFNPTIRLQRTTTLMEGGQVCDFRIYAVDETGEAAG